MQTEQPQKQVFQLSEFGYQIIETYKIRAKKYALQDQKLNQMAQKLFLQDIFSIKMSIKKKWIIVQQLGSKGLGRMRQDETNQAEKQFRQKLVKQQKFIPNTHYS
ncbi:unnamed protein product [Paramecium primaurelia]|uniref:Uncharacterized protein n=1 Tax=Paramecium primaurelia TaxID=5886 RepID=A0A8S1LYG0_PARPR|nr:unnamed protein product [Paramecium primaurelia]